jgi:hypothetical protein
MQALIIIGGYAGIALLLKECGRVLREFFLGDDDGESFGS